MTLPDLKQDIMYNTIKNFYIFTGSEIGIINIYLKQMSKVLNLPITRADTVVSVYSKCTSKSIFGVSKGFYVIRDDLEFMKQEKFYESIKSDIGKNNVIVVLYEKIDSRLKFGKYFKDNTVPFEKLATNVLIRYIHKECSMSERNCKMLAEVCDGSYDLCILECNKINQYSIVQGIDVNVAFKELFNCGVIYQPENTDVFNFVEAVCNKQRKQAFSVAQILEANNVSAINILGTLYNSLKTIMLIQAYGNGNGVCDVTGLDSKQVYFNKKYCGKYSTEHLAYSIELISNTISDIKSGAVNESCTIEYVLVNIM